MGANALLVSRDNGVQMVLPAVLLEARIETEIAPDVPRAIQLLRERKFETGRHARPSGDALSIPTGRIKKTTAILAGRQDE
jgi:hypothetical protein